MKRCGKARAYPDGFEFVNFIKWRIRLLREPIGVCSWTVVLCGFLCLRCHFNGGFCDFIVSHRNRPLQGPFMTRPENCQDIHIESVMWGNRLRNLGQSFWASWWNKEADSSQSCSSEREFGLSINYTQFSAITISWSMTSAPACFITFCNIIITSRFGFHQQGSRFVWMWAWIWEADLYYNVRSWTNDQ